MIDHRPRILMVDDEPLNLDYLEQELEESNFELITAVNGKEALDKIRSESPDLVLLDIMMPIMDGFAVLELAKADPATRNIPIIVISANDDLQSVVQGIQKGAEDYLSKPFEPTILQARISSSLEKKRLRDQEQLYLQSLQREMNIARDIQNDFLPLELPNVPGWKIAAYFKAANTVAGDYYDSFTLPDGNLVCILGDVCGKGVGAALFMTLFRSLIRATFTSSYFMNEAVRNMLAPAERLEHAISFTNSYVASTHEQTLVFSTVFIGLLDIKKGTLTYINAGNEAPYLIHKDGMIEELRPSGPVVGFLPDAKFNVRETQMDRDDFLLAFTDGIPDSKNPQDEFFGLERARLVLEREHSDPLNCVNLLGGELSTFIEDADQFDDITILAIQRTA